MQERKEGDVLNFAMPKQKPCIIKVIGVGGGGGNASRKTGSKRVRLSVADVPMGTCAGIINKPSAMKCRAIALLMPLIRAASSR